MVHHPKKYYVDIKQSELKLCELTWWERFSYGILLEKQDTEMNV